MINIICNIIIIVSVISLFVAIAADFVLYDDKTNTKQAKKSIVATGTMVGFYFVYYLILRFNIGNINLDNSAFIIIGTLMIVFGSIANIVSRFFLGKNWANHIKIYDNHTLVTKGFYKIVRHPLYASIMLMLFGGSMVYRNWLSFMLTAFIFIPFTYYRAKQEETLLLKEFSEYEKYKNKTGMFFPKIWR